MTSLKNLFNRFTNFFSLKIVIYIVSIITLFTILLSLFSVSYYFLVSLPEFNKTKLQHQIELEEQSRTDKINIELQKLAQQKELEEQTRINKIKQEEQKQANLDKCLDNAYIDYTENWTAYTGEKTGDTCKKIPSCKLPSGTSDELNEFYFSAQDNCYKRYL